MSADEPTPEEQGAAWLAAYDQALAEGGAVQEGPAADPPGELQPRLKRNAAFLRLLADVWPRPAPPDTPPHPPVAPAAEELPTQLGRFRIARELGRGGCGIVFLAYDSELRRDIALKVPRAEALLDAESRDRFLREARAAAGLDHANIVPVHEAGTAGALCYIASAYCPGPSLAEWLRTQSEPVPARAAADLVALLAAAVQHAHERGVIHRDLKPANVLMQPRALASAPCGLEDFMPRVTDFGLAKLLHGGAAQTQTGHILGTPSYMAPEQAAGKTHAIGPAADVHALGAILYELLIGRPPFRAETVMETLLQVQTEEPVPPARLRPKLPRDLETVCLKCLQKEPAKRYLSARDLADDLRCFLEGKPVQARPVGAMERLWRWGRRNPAVAAAILVTAVALTTLSVGAIGFALYQAEANRQLSATNTDLVNAEMARHRFTRLSALLALDRGLERCEKGEPHEGVRWMATALEINPPGEDHLASVIRTNVAAWGARLCPVIAVLPHTDWVNIVSFSPDGQMILTGGDDFTVRLWDADGRPLRVINLPHRAYAAAWDPDGRTILVGGDAPGTPGVSVVSGQARRWDLATGQPVGDALLNQLPIIRLAYSPDGRTAAALSNGGFVRLLDMSADRPVLLLELMRQGDGPNRNVARAVAFSPDGTKLLTGSTLHTPLPSGQGSSVRQQVQLWNVGAGKPWGNISEKAWDIEGPGGALLTVAFSDDGETILTAGMAGEVRQWKTATGEPLGVLAPAQELGTVAALAFSPDGRVVLSGDARGHTRHWNADRGGAVGRSPVHPGSIRAVALRRDGKRALTCGTDGTARLWQLTADEPGGPVLSHDDWVQAAAFSPDGKAALTGSRDGKFRLWDVATWALAGEAIDLAAGVNPSARGQGVRAAAFSPDGTLFVTASDAAHVQRWDTATRRPVGGPLRHSAWVYSVAFSPDGSTLATGGRDGTTRLWKAATGEELRSTGRERGPILGVAFSPDGRVLLTGCAGRTARLWDTATGQPLSIPLPQHEDPVRGVAFTPEGKAMLTATDYRVHLWDAATARPLEVGMTLTGRSEVMALSSDGKTLATGGPDLRLWDVATGRQLGPALAHPMSVNAIAFSPNGKQVLTGCQDHSARVWSVPQPRRGTVEEVLRWVRVSTLLEQHENGALRPIDPQTWQELHRELEQAGSAFTPQ